MTEDGQKNIADKPDMPLTIDEIFSVIPDLIFVLDKSDRILEYRAGNTSDLYLPPNQFLGKSMCQVLPFKVARQVKKAIRQCLKSKQIAVAEYELEVQHQLKWFEARISYSNHERIIMFVRDISELKHKQASIIHQANHDSLTGLYNRSFAIDYLNQKLKEAKRHHTKTSVFFIDIDNFKELNDKFGHDYGDSVLISVAHAIASAIRDKDLIARFGGDEFMIVLEGNNPNHVLKKIALKIINKLDLLEFKKHPPITVSIGIASSEDEEISSNKLISYADVAMYESKHIGKHAITIYKPNMHF
ncbi:sensor domain-containing diguanylate cyclase [Pseudoalteromonas phenolica]|uniref:GGDEF domain-containing protein n=1 Tax=Pseudoalteromonas phenolica TaxID=161398 RepID=A0A0S2K325_9GAMM|nr:sensor domain-containing diguanylate cyclase [Pseudoalteromonas phenolica]ALO42715.1 hypothetical protein PP2015_2218 [Pseudoalteromonas phenolica]MBE0356177.1 hypothetical protein [Pseudoalteromonas phenolica O-BC30]